MLQRASFLLLVRKRKQQLPVLLEEIPGYRYDATVVRAHVTQPPGGRERPIEAGQQRRRDVTREYGDGHATAATCLPESGEERRGEGDPPPIDSAGEGKAELRREEMGEGARPPAQRAREL